MDDPRCRLAETCRLLFARALSDASGGNLSLRHGEHLYLTPRRLASRYHWQITAAQISVVNLQGQVLEGPGDLTREAAIHLRVYGALPLAGAVIHAHPPYALVFAVAGRPIVSDLEVMEGWSPVPVAEYAPAHSAELAANAVQALLAGSTDLAEHPLAAILPRHGVVVVGRDMEQAYDGLERLEAAARCQLLGRLLG